MEALYICLFDAVDKCHMCLISTWNVTRMNEKLDFNFVLNLNSHTWLVATTLDSWGESLAMQSVVHGPAVSILPGCLLDVQYLLPSLEPTEPESTF